MRVRPIGSQPQGVRDEKFKKSLKPPVPRKKKKKHQKKGKTHMNLAGPQDLGKSFLEGPQDGSLSTGVLKLLEVQVDGPW